MVGTVRTIFTIELISYWLISWVMNFGAQRWFCNLILIFVSPFLRFL